MAIRKSTLALTAADKPGRAPLATRRARGASGDHRRRIRPRDHRELEALLRGIDDADDALGAEEAFASASLIDCGFDDLDGDGDLSRLASGLNPARAYHDEDGVDRW
ncbi:hypothetical protein [Methylobacterium soli]|uniref:Uncharacterized protein n=1 Tax=Methylobacterium soli TaxID=553447 RepID=A0A6L3SX50_9HYPH|nr:hypothetical protein [Methylobacterium soli]KAB1076740.1 hypothetical protein F6X53_21865 [Methylobacterium soli]GJE45831.1 hypothetical protein AEGHOMDF_5031 [Methylobacterium soli]